MSAAKQILTPFDAQSDTWTKLMAHYAPKLAGYRARIESTATPDVERAALAWKISAIKELMALAPSQQ